MSKTQGMTVGINLAAPAPLFEPFTAREAKNNSYLFLSILCLLPLLGARFIEEHLSPHKLLFNLYFTFYFTAAILFAGVIFMPILNPLGGARFHEVMFSSGITAYTAIGLLTPFALYF